jgi:hypothetical protein
VQLLKLRYFQIKRDLSYWFIIIVLGVFYVSKNVSEISFNYRLILSVSYLVILLNYHYNRKDLNFLSKYFGNPKLNLCLNYNLLTLPISLANFLSQNYLYCIVLHLSVTLIPFLVVKPSSPKLIFMKRFVPASQFEWIAGLRSSFYLLIPLFILVLFFSPVKFFGPVTLFLLNTIFLGFYKYFEPLLMLNPEGLSSEDFLDRKIKFLMKTILIFNVPPLLINSVFNLDVAWFNICFLIGFGLLASCTIYMKYSDYKPNEEQPFHMDSLLVFSAVLIPFFLPISYLLNKSYKKKALINLINYT